jgi:hypothetical protein
MQRIMANPMNARADGVRFSTCLESRRHRPSHAKVLSTIHRFGKTIKSLAVSDQGDGGCGRLALVTAISEYLLDKRKESAGFGKYS